MKVKNTKSDAHLPKNRLDSCLNRVQGLIVVAFFLSVVREVHSMLFSIFLLYDSVNSSDSVLEGSSTILLFYLM